MGLSITPLSPHTGAEVRGIDLTGGIDEATRAHLNRAFVERSVLVIRDQTLAPTQMLDAVRLFGEVFEQHNTKFSLPDCPLVHYISNKDFFPDGRRYIPGEGYHTDHSNAAEPPKATVLHAIELPDTAATRIRPCIAYGPCPMRPIAHRRLKATRLPEPAQCPEADGPRTDAAEQVPGGDPPRRASERRKSITSTRLPTPSSTWTSGRSP